MATTSVTTSSYYYVLNEDAVFMDFAFPLEGFTFKDQGISYSGNNGVDAVYIGSASGMVFDFSNTQDQADKIYLEGALSDYTFSVDGFKTFSLQRTGDTNETILLTSGDDLLVFSNGTVTTKAFFTYAKAYEADSSTALAPTPEGEKSSAFPIAAPEGFTPNNDVYAYVTEEVDTTLGIARPGVAMVISGNNGIDTIYVSEGGTVDATNTQDGADLIYLMGEIGDYAATQQGLKTVSLTRTVTVEGVEHTETVSFNKGDDIIVFANGAASATDIRSSITDGKITSVTSAASWDASKTTPLPSGPVIKITAPDAYINDAEDESALTISGTSENAAKLAATITVGDITKETTVNFNGTWSVNLTSAELKTLDEGSVSITATVEDNNGKSSKASSSFVYDIQKPTVVITNDVTEGVKANIESGDITYTFTFSEGVTGFTVDDVSVVNGQKGTFTTVSSSVYTLVVTPTDNLTGNVTVDVAADVATDAAGNSNLVATQSVQAVDIVAPTVTITDDETLTTGNIVGGSITYTFTFSEEVEGFTIDDVVVAAGSAADNVSLGELTQSSSDPKVYTLVVTPKSGFAGDITVNVAKDVAVDAGNNGNAVATESTQAVDMGAPTAPENAPAAATGALATPGKVSSTEFANTIDIVVNVAGSGAKADDIVELLIDGESFATTTGTIKTLTVSDITNGVTLTIAAEELIGDGARELTARVTDAAGNPGPESSALTLTVNTGAAPKPVSIAIQDPDAALTNSDALTYRVTFTEKVKSVSEDDFDLVDGTTAIDSNAFSAEAVTGSDNKIWDVTFTGGDIASYNGTATLKFAASPTITDVDNKALTEFDSLSASYVLDNTAPAKATTAPTTTIGSSVNAAESAAGFDVAVTFAGTNAEVGDAVELLLAGASFATPLTHTLTQDDLDNGYTFSLPAGALGADTSGTNTKKITMRVVDQAGNNGTESAALALTKDTVAPDPLNTPTVDVDSGLGDGVSKSEYTDTDSVPTVTVSTGALGSGNVIQLLLADTVIAETTLTSVAGSHDFDVTGLLGASDGSADGAKVLTARAVDAAGNQGVASSALTLTLDTIAPTLTSIERQTPTTASTNANTLVYRATFSEDVTGTVAAADFAVSAGDTNIAISKVEKVAAGVYDITVTGSDLANLNSTVTLSMAADAAINDLAGNSFAGSSISTAYTIDNVDPAKPTTKPSGLSDLFINSTESATGFNITVSLAGTNAVAGDTVELLLNEQSFTTPLTKVLSATNVTNGYVTLKVAANSLGDDGQKSLYSRVTDAAGNDGPLSDPYTFTLDTSAPTAPSAPTIAVLSSDSEINAVQAAKGFDVTVQLATGTGVTGSTVELYLNGAAFEVPVKTTLTENATSVTLNIPADSLGEQGDKSLTALITDKAGNTSSASTALEFSLDLGAAPKISYSAKQFYESIDNDGTVDNTLTISLSGATFAGDVGDVLVKGSQYTVSNLPTEGSLNTRLVKASDTTLTLSLTGAATKNLNADDVSNLTITFKDSAFQGTSASAIQNVATADLKINFASDTATSKVMTYSPGVTGTTGDDIIYVKSDADLASQESAIVVAGDGSDTIDISLGTNTSNGSAEIQIAQLDHGPDYIVGFKAGANATGGDVLNLDGIISGDNTVSVKTGLSAASTDFGTSATNVFIFDSTIISIATAAEKIAGDADIAGGADGFIVIKDSSKGGLVSVYHSDDLGADGTETLVAMLSGTTIGSLIAENLLI